MSYLQVVMYYFAYYMNESNFQQFWEDFPRFSNIVRTFPINLKKILKITCDFR